MAVRVGKVVFDDWVSLSLPGGWSDTFVFRLSPRDGLPPGDYAHLIRSFMPSVFKLRRSLSLWVQICDENDCIWFDQAIQQTLRGLCVPTVVTRGYLDPQLWDFSFFPWVNRSPSPPPPSTGSYLNEKELPISERACLRVLARADCAYTAEVASLADLGLKTARRSLRRLEEKGRIDLVAEGRYPFWRIRRSGLTLALRSWSLPPGWSFPERKERGLDACKERESLAYAKKRRTSAGRHRRTARLWPAWLRRAWPRAQVWAGWSEVACERSRPDALCWGRMDGYETLYWLEVEGGTVSGAKLRRKTLSRLNKARTYARRFPVRLVFALLGPPWVRKEVVGVFQDLPRDVAVVLEDWKAFGTLPVPEWGWVRWK